MGEELSDVTRGWVAALIDGIANRYDRWRTRTRQKNQLRKALRDPRWEWRTFEALQLAIREEDPETTKALLLEIGARPSEKEKDVWKLE
jgi:hypothetical protein